MRTDKNNPNEIKPEVYMLSDQAQALEREGFFTDSGSRKMMKIREPQEYIMLYIQQRENAKLH
jgi:hypothetical protein